MSFTTNSFINLKSTEYELNDVERNGWMILLRGSVVPLPLKEPF